MMSAGYRSNYYWHRHPGDLGSDPFGFIGLLYATQRPAGASVQQHSRSSSTFKLKDLDFRHIHMHCRGTHFRNSLLDPAQQASCILWKHRMILPHSYELAYDATLMKVLMKLDIKPKSTECKI